MLCATWNHSGGRLPLTRTGKFELYFSKPSVLGLEAHLDLDRDVSSMILEFFGSSQGSLSVHMSRF
jgi:hypothetical protein